MSEITITKATIEDLEIFYPFFEKGVKKFFANEYTGKTLDYFFQNTYSKDGALRTIKDNNTSIYIAKDGDAIVGFLWQSGKASGGVAFGDWLAVDENQRGKGIGSKLLQAWQEDCLKKGVHVLRINTEEHNIKFYEKNGFILIGLFPKGHYGADDYHMYKPIQEPKEENYLR